MNFLALFFISGLLLFSSCAPRAVQLPPFEEKSLDQVIAERSGISRIDTTFSIIFEKADSEIRGEGDLKLSRSGDLELRVYSLGIPAMELSSRDGAVKSIPRLDTAKKAVLTQGLRDGFFWWDMKDFTTVDKDGLFILRNQGREVAIDKRTGLPVQQRLYLPDGKVLDITYDSPAQEGGLTYQSKMKIDLSRYSVTLQVKTIRFGT
jgi:hypothetical protein